MAETAGGGSQFSRLDALCLSPTSREIHPEEQNIHPLLLNRRDIAGCEINCEADSIGLPAMFFVAAFVSKHQDFAFSLKPINPIILIRVRPMMHLILMIFQLLIKVESSLKVIAFEGFKLLMNSIHMSFPTLI